MIFMLVETIETNYPLVSSEGKGFLLAVISVISNIYHNHPSGHVNPSPEDIELLKRSTLIT